MSMGWPSSLSTESDTRWAGTVGRAIAALAWSYRHGPPRYFVASVGALGIGLVMAGATLVAWLRAAGPET